MGYLASGEQGSEKMMETADGAGASHASVVTVPRRWLKFLRRVMGLAPGRYQLVLSVQTDRCDWTIMDLGRIERE